MVVRRLAIPIVIAVALVSGRDAIAQPQGRGEFVPRPNRRPFRPIVDATFLKVDEVTDQVRDNELVLGIVIDDVPRAYPINMLTGPRREIINDTLAGRAIAATW